ncbi:MAG: polysaccharide biosynthesis tyrosine autokinase [Crocinitomicaceae bacterium]|nr:polysaccharide biosynthesis tyrosine autokinase [Crocinitomicaceae bacterium]
MSKQSTSNKLIELKDLKVILKLLRKNLIILVLIPVFAYLAGYVYSYRLNDIFGARAQVLLKSDDTYDYQDPIYKGLGAYGMFMDVRNQIRILQSRDLIGEVVDKIEVDVSYFIAGRMRKKEVFGTLPFNASAEIYNPSVIYENPIKVKVLDVDNYIVSYLNNGVESTYNAQFENELETPELRLVLSKNYSFAPENINRIIDPDYEIVFRSRNSLIHHFQSNMSIENIEYTSILDVRVNDDIAMRAKVFLDTLCAVFSDYSQRSQLEINQNTLDNIDKQIGEVQKILIAIENDLISYKDSADIINLKMEEDAYFENFVRFTESSRLLRMKLSSVTSLEEYLKTSSDETPLPPDDFLIEGDKYIQTKMEEYYELQTKILDQEHSVQPNHPSIVDARSSLAVIRKDLSGYLKSLKTVLYDQITENNKLVGEYKSDVQGIPRSMQGVDNIKRELDVNNKMYLFLLEKKTNTLIARAGIIPQVEIVESAQPIGLVGPDKKRINFLFFIGGIIFAFAIAIIRMLFFERIEQIDELEDVAVFPVLAGIPHVKSYESPLIALDLPKSPVTESFRSLKTKLNYFGENKGLKKILVSSFFPGEGKTFTSSNLSIILAKSDKKVLLVDFDLHKPKIHKSFELINEFGLSHYLIGEKELEDVIQKNVHGNLDIISAGVIPPNPADLISKKELQDLISYCEENYDFLIFDTPPFGILNDGIDLAANVDVFLAVMNTKVARKQGVEVVEKMISQEGVKSALILNGVKQSRFGYYYNKYSYNYSYRYSYNSSYSNDEN